MKKENVMNYIPPSQSSKILKFEERKAFKKGATDAHEVLFLLPPNIEFEDFLDPPGNVGTIQKGDMQFGSVITDIPLGVISLSAYLKKFLSVESTCIDFNVELNRDENFTHTSFIDYFYDRIRSSVAPDYQPDYVAISSFFTTAYQSIIDLAAIARQLFLETTILVGGSLPTSMYQEILADSQDVDVVCFGEGEKPFLNLIEAHDKYEYINLSQSWITHEKITNNNKNLAHDFIWDLDEIPYLDYEMLDIEDYKLNPTLSRYSISNNYEVDSSFLEDTIRKNIELNPKPFHSIPIMTSRGCPFKCTFCASYAAHGRSMRYHSLDRVIEDIKRLVSSYEITGVVIQDDHFMAGKRRPYEIVDAIGNRKLEMFFQNALAIYALDKDFLKLLKNVGVNELVLPVESGSEKVLKQEMRKPLKLSRIPEVVRNCREIGIYTDCNIIIGMPGETKQDIKDSREFLKSIYADWFRVFVATPIPGSEMHETVVQNNYYKVSPIKANYKRAVIQTEHLTPEYVQYMTYYMNIELNFVYNSNLRLGRFERALEGFLNVVNVKPDHALAHFYASHCLERLGREDEAEKHLTLALSFIEESDFWNDFIVDFEIPVKALVKRNIEGSNVIDKEFA